MGYLNNIHNTEGYKIISGFGNTFVCDKAIDANKTITFPDGWDNDTNLSFKVIFKYGHNCADDQTHMTLNSIPIVVNQYGILIPLPIHEMNDGGTTVYKSLQPNTILEMYYTNDYDGNNNSAYVVIGNPIVLSSTDYTIYADGQNGNPHKTWNTEFDWTDAGGLNKSIQFSEVIPKGKYLVNVSLNSSSSKSWSLGVSENQVLDFGSVDMVHLEATTSGSMHCSGLTVLDVTSPTNTLYVSGASSFTNQDPRHIYVEVIQF